MKKNKIINTFFGEKLINCSKFLLGVQVFSDFLFFEKYILHIIYSIFIVMI